MPIYEYVCKKCHKKFELLRKFSDKTPATCPKCGSNDVERTIPTFTCVENPGFSKGQPGKTPWESS